MSQQDRENGNTGKSAQKPYNGQRKNRKPAGPSKNRYDKKDAEAKSESDGAISETEAVQRVRGARGGYSQQQLSGAQAAQKSQKQNKPRQPQGPDRQSAHTPSGARQRDGEQGVAQLAGRGDAPKADKTSPAGRTTPADKAALTDKTAQAGKAAQARVRSPEQGGTRERGAQADRDKQVKGRGTPDSSKGGTASASQSDTPGVGGNSAANKSAGGKSGGAAGRSGQTASGNAAHGAAADAAHGAVGRAAYGSQGAGGGRGRHSQQAALKKIKAEETLEDIRIDITRIEKEIDLEIKEIQNLKLVL